MRTPLSIVHKKLFSFGAFWALCLAMALLALTLMAGCAKKKVPILTFDALKKELVKRPYCRTHPRIFEHNDIAEDIFKKLNKYGTETVVMVFVDYDAFLEKAVAKLRDANRKRKIYLAKYMAPHETFTSTTVQKDLNFAAAIDGVTGVSAFSFKESKEFPPVLAGFYNASLVDFYGKDIVKTWMKPTELFYIYDTPSKPFITVSREVAEEIGSNFEQRPGKGFVLYRLSPKG